MINCPLHRCYLPILLAFLFFTASFNTPLRGQQTYKFDLATDAVLTGSGVLMGSLYFPLSQRLNGLSPNQIAVLDLSMVNSFDRIATRQNSVRAKNASDIFLVASYSLPLTLMLNKECRDESGIIGLMLLETALINAGITRLTKVSAKRVRPLAYNPDISLSEKMRPRTRYSFFSGHASNAAALSFFTAKVFSDKNPDHRLKPLVWATAIILPATTAFFRVKAGQHFPTDVIIGYAVGASVGLLVPALHKKRK